MHILHIIDSLAPGGAERMLVDIANATFADGHQVSVCITRSRDDLAKQLASGIPLHILHRQQRFDIVPLRRLGRIVCDERVDLLHVHSRSTLSLLAFARSLGLLNRRIPIVMHDHFGAIESRPAAPAWLRWWTKNHISRYVGVHPLLAEFAKRAGIPPTHIRVITNALDLQRLSRPKADVSLLFGLDGTRPIGICVGSLSQRKGTDLLVEALKRQTLSFNFLIVGPDAEIDFAQACRQQMNGHALAEHVHFTGARSDVPTLLAGCDFLVIPSRSESGPLVLIEGMMAGLPFVCSLVGDIAHQVAAVDPTGFVPPGDVDALTQTIHEMLSSSADDRRARGLALQAIAQQRFDIRQVMPQWYDVYRQCMSNGNG